MLWLLSYCLKHKFTCYFILHTYCEKTYVCLPYPMVKFNTQMSNWINFGAMDLSTPQVKLLELLAISNPNLLSTWCKEQFKKQTFVWWWPWHIKKRRWRLQLTKGFQNDEILGLMAKCSKAWNLTKHINANVRYYENCESSTKIYKFVLILYVINNIVDIKNIWYIFIKYKIYKIYL